MSALVKQLFKPLLDAMSRPYAARVNKTLAAYGLRYDDLYDPLKVLRFERAGPEPPELGRRCCGFSRGLGNLTPFPLGNTFPLTVVRRTRMSPRPCVACLLT